MDYVPRHTAEGLSKREIIRCLKRYLAREVYHRLAPLDKPRSTSKRASRPTPTTWMRRSRRGTWCRRPRCRCRRSSSRVGLHREAAAAAFARYLSDKTLSANQIRFIQLIVEHLTANGVMEVARLYESPFTDNAPQGPDMIIGDQVDGIVAVLHDVRQHALPGATVA